MAKQNLQKAKVRKNLPKVKLIVRPVYDAIAWAIMLLIMLAFSIVPNIIWKTDPLVWKIIDIIFFSVLAIMCAYILLQNCQFAELSDKGIDIKNVFGSIAFIAWEKVQSISIEKVCIYNSRAHIFVDWIVIRTGKPQEIYFAKNKKNVPPWLITASKKNIAEMQVFLSVYRPDLQKLLKK